MEKTKIKNEKRTNRHKRIRAKVFGTAQKPRLSVFKSNKFITAQLIDDVNSKTLVYLSSQKINGKTPLEKSKNVGLEIAKRAQEQKIKQVVFDRGGYIYTGNVEALASGAREGGLVF